MIEHPYSRFLAEINRPGQYLGGEFGAATIPETADLRIAFAYPDSYEIGMSHMGMAVLYELINAMERMACERVFMPWPDLESKLREAEVPLVSLETARPLKEFDVVGFSLQYELNYTNLLAMLDLGQVPLRASNRTENDPIVLVGGPLAMHCEPIAPFVDLCLIGDGEEALAELLKTACDLKKRSVDRSRVIDELAAHASVFAPNRMERVYDPDGRRMVASEEVRPVAKRALVGSLGKQPPGLGPVPTVKTVFDRYSVEVARGCTSGCRFCQASFLYRPVRERTVEEIENAVERSVTCLGFDSVSLAALSTADHSCIVPLIAKLGEEYTPRRVSLAVPSLRAYGLSDDVVEVLGRLRATGVTLAPEAGSQRMRDVINKNVQEEDLNQAAARFFDRGFFKIKLYFMLGLPGETDADLEAIVHLADRLRDLGRKRLRGRTPNIIVSVSTFVPKPFTPFEREAMIPIDEIRRRQDILKTLGKQKRLEVRVHDPRLSVLEGILCRGDYRLAPMLETAVARGARFDGWDDMYNGDVWQTILAECDVALYLDAIPDNARLPWDHVDALVEQSFLRSERNLARDGEAREPCGRFTNPNEKKPMVVCHKCGLKCPPESLPLRQPKPAPNADLGPLRQRSAKLRPEIAQQDGIADAVRIRLFLAKWGRQVFIGHLDTMRHVMYGLRRAGLELVYTQGFHPKPKISAAPPLPLGTVGLQEPIDIHVVDPPTIDEILSRLKRALPQEMEIVAAQKIEPGKRSLSKMLRDAKYVALVAVDSGAARAAMDRFMASDSIEIERERKGKTKRIDIRPYVVEAEVRESGSEELRLPEADDRVAVAFTLALPPSGGARATEVLRAAFGEAAEDAWVVRTEFVIDS